MAKERKSLKYYLSLRYPVTLVPEAEEGYSAMIPDLPGCLSVGETPEEALAMIEDARRLWIETAYENGDEIPLPSTGRTYSGRLLVRMPRSLHRRLAEGAAREGVSLNQYVVALLQEASALREIRHEITVLRDEIAGFKAEPPKVETSSKRRRTKKATKAAE